MPSVPGRGVSRIRALCHGPSRRVVGAVVGTLQRLRMRTSLIIAAGRGQGDDVRRRSERVAALTQMPAGECHRFERYQHDQHPAHP